MQLGNPVEDFVPKSYPNGDVTQWFGENKPLYSKICNIFSCMTGGHNGIDIVRVHGTQIYCVMGGKIVQVYHGTGYGKRVRILSDDGYEYTYGHLSSFDCKQGEYIKKGDKVGKMGNTGFTVSGATPFWKYNPYAGTHLHLGKRKYTRTRLSDPHNMTYPTGDAVQIHDYDNGTFGAVPITAGDFIQSFNDHSTEEAIERIEKLAEQYEREQHKDSKILRAIIAIIRAFGI